MEPSRREEKIQRLIWTFEVEGITLTREQAERAVDNAATSPMLEITERKRLEQTTSTYTLEQQSFNKATNYATTINGCCSVMQREIAKREGFERVEWALDMLESAHERLTKWAKEQPSFNGDIWGALTSIGDYCLAIRRELANEKPSYKTIDDLARWIGVMNGKVSTWLKGLAVEEAK